MYVTPLHRRFGKPRKDTTPANTHPWGRLIWTEMGGVFIGGGWVFKGAAAMRCPFLRAYSGYASSHICESLHVKEEISKNLHHGIRLFHPRIGELTVKWQTHCLSRAPAQTAAVSPDALAWSGAGWSPTGNVARRRKNPKAKMNTKAYTVWIGKIHFAAVG